MDAKGVAGWIVAAVLGGVLIGKNDNAQPPKPADPPAAQASAQLGNPETLAEALPETLYVQSASLNCRTEPKTSARVVERLKRNDNVAVMQAQGGWWLLDRDYNCWASAALLAEERAPTPVADVEPRRQRDEFQNFSAAPVMRTALADGLVSYSNCSAARAAGAAPVRRGEPGYSRRLDRDGDGVGCE